MSGLVEVAVTVIASCLTCICENCKMVHSFCWGHSKDLKCHEFNALLALASRRGRWYEAIELLTRAPSLKVTPDIATWMQLGNGFQIGFQMLIFNMFPTRFVFTSTPVPGRICNIGLIVIDLFQCMAQSQRQAIHLWSLLMQRPCTLADSGGQTAKFANWASSKCLYLWCSHQCCRKSIRS